MNMKKNAMGIAVIMALCGTTANAITTTGNNLTVLGGTGGLTGGTNDVTFTWDGSYRTAVVTDGSSNASLSSPTPFFGSNWTVHHMNIYASGTYTFETQCPAGNPACGAPASSARYNLTIPTGYVGAHMLYDWSTSVNTDVVLLWKPNASWDATGGELGNGGISPDPFCNAPLANGGCNINPNPNGNTRYTVWDAVSVDTPASTNINNSFAADNETNVYHGTKMIDGPTTGQSFNFNVQGVTAPVPVPAAAWLLGSGLAGLMATARRRRKAPSLTT